MTVYPLMTTAPSLHAFSVLTPDFVIQAVESRGYLGNGRILALNSYENRVYQVGIEDADPIIVKFYRPQRWTIEQIIEEHDFTYELYEHELPVVTPIRTSGIDGNEGGASLSFWHGMPFALFLRKGGRAPELDNLDNLYTLGQSLGRMHGVGKASAFQYRPALTIASYGHESMQYLLEHSIPDSLKHAYETLAKDLLAKIEQTFSRVDSLQNIRCHGDCHMGNILWRDDAPHYVDFDDARMAPAIQDLWMLLSGDRYNQTIQLSEIIEGYSMFNDFNLAEIALIEPLRTLRMMHYCAWLARRWDDPAFPLHFPWFNSERYWGEHILQLREQLYALNEPSIELR